MICLSGSSKSVTCLLGQGWLCGHLWGSQPVCRGSLRMLGPKQGSREDLQTLAGTQAISLASIETMKQEHARSIQIGNRESIACMYIEFTLKLKNFNKWLAGYHNYNIYSNGYFVSFRYFVLLTENLNYFFFLLQKGNFVSTGARGCIPLLC